jgi:hypothetical protein
MIVVFARLAGLRPAELAMSVRRCYHRTSVLPGSSPKRVLPALGQRLADACALIGDVAQLGERLVCNQEVAGSIPVVST